MPIINSMLEKIRKAKVQQDTSLELHGNYTKIPDAIGELQQLTSLSLYGVFTEIPASIGNLQQLTSLMIEGSYTEIPASIGNLQQLTSLALTGKYTEIPASIGNLQQLTSLGLTGKYTEIPASIGNLQQLTSLVLRDSYTEIPASIENLQRLTSLVLRGSYTEIPASIGNLQRLTSLVIEGNYTEIPASIGNLQRLTSLSLYGIYTEIPELIYSLKDLKYLTITSRYLESISPKILQLSKLDKLRTETRRIQSPPPEIVRAGLEAIHQYFQQLQQDEEDYLYEAKLLIVGEGGAGKTSLARKLVNPQADLPNEDETTWGIHVNQWRFPIENGKIFRVNIWDFGGQEIYHATHQFFLTSRSLYVLVADTRKEDTDFYYWLNVVELLSNKSPLLIVKNEKQDRPRQINETALRGRFEIVKDVLATNLQSGRGLEKIRDFITVQMKYLEHVGTPLPKRWVDVRRRLEENPENYIRYIDFEKICQEEGITKTETIETLIRYLHDLGVCLHFSDEVVLKKFVILKPAWATNAVYDVLHFHAELIKAKQGRFDRDNLDTIWNKPEYENMQDVLLRLMMKFGLCYKIPEAELYIAPQLLSDNEPKYAWNKIGNLVIGYEYEFMPKGLLSRFIVQRHRQIDNNLVWKTGVIIKTQDGRAEIKESLDKREISIRIDGKDKKNVLAIILDEFDSIHQSFHNLAVQTRVPCNCDDCRNEPPPHFFKLDDLKRMEEKGKPVVCLKSGELIRPSALINDVFPYNRRDERDF